MLSIFKEPKVQLALIIVAGVVVVFLVTSFMGGGETKQEAQFNGDGNVQSSDNSRDINVSTSNVNTLENEVE